MYVYCQLSIHIVTSCSITVFWARNY